MNEMRIVLTSRATPKALLRFITRHIEGALPPSRPHIFCPAEMPRIRPDSLAHKAGTKR